jgi:DNA modification methylase
MWDESFGKQDPSISSALEHEDGDMAFELMHSLLDKVWKECFRVLKAGAFACINVGDAVRTLGGNFRLYPNHSRIMAGFGAAGFQALPFILWRKPTNAPNKFMGSGMLPSGAYVTLEHEYILVFRKGGKRSFTGADQERRRRSAFFWEERNSWFSDIWDLRGSRQSLEGNGARNRSAAFPFELAFRLVQMYSLQEDTVLDPFLGTGTSSAAALVSGRNSIGIELEREFFPSVEARLSSAEEFGTLRQKRRLADHHTFIEEYRIKQSKEPKHLNIPYGFPVITRQECYLSLPLISKIKQKPDPDIFFKAEHILP